MKIEVETKEKPVGVTIDKMIEGKLYKFNSETGYYRARCGNFILVFNHGNLTIRTINDTSQLNSLYTEAPEGTVIKLIF